MRRRNWSILILKFIFLVGNYSCLMLISRNFVCLNLFFLTLWRMIWNTNYFIICALTFLLWWRFFRDLVKLLIEFDISFFLKFGWVFWVIHFILLPHIVVVILILDHNYIFEVWRLICGHIQLWLGNSLWSCWHMLLIWLL